MSNPAEQAFTLTAATYDTDRARLIPGFDSFYGWAVELVPKHAESILDLGAGTGLYAALVRERLPAAQMHLVDISEAMLAKARERFAGDGRVTFAVADYSAGLSTAPFDAVISALSIHHLEDTAKRALFTRIREVLKPGGVFVNADQVLGPTPELEARYKALWLKQVRALGATEEQIRDSLFRQQEDHCATVDDQLAWMREAGFQDVDCWFKNGRFAVMAGLKPDRYDGSKR
jgi:tRNA (cmo5U34)-methyltransferase